MVQSFASNNPDLLEQEPDLEEFYYTEDDLKNPINHNDFIV